MWTALHFLALKPHNINIVLNHTRFWEWHRILSLVSRLSDCWWRMVLFLRLCKFSKEIISELQTNLMTLGSSIAWSKKCVWCTISRRHITRRVFVFFLLLVFHSSLRMLHKYSSCAIHSTASWRMDTYKITNAAWEYSLLKPNLWCYNIFVWHYFKDAWAVEQLKINFENVIKDTFPQSLFIVSANKACFRC
jgi:hypothetical protein